MNRLLAALMFMSPAVAAAADGELRIDRLTHEMYYLRVALCDISFLCNNLYRSSYR